MPASLRIHHHDRASLLAGKLHATLHRPWLKGRDIYDLVWYLSDPAWPEPNLDLLNAARRQTEPTAAALTEDTWRETVRRGSRARSGRRSRPMSAPFWRAAKRCPRWPTRWTCCARTADPRRTRPASLERAV
ncbi:MAG: nucleotidyl transferase AbiEii/AbiGii toxin family protein [Gemmatimonadales bacterium]|nr:nucleotidyl transferase AbiEii/AbiGii toxin family protein [Gemmatimonadales bacterium]